MTARERRIDKTAEAKRPTRQRPKRERSPSDPAATADALARKAEAIRQAQLDLTVRKLPGLTEEQRDSLDAMTKALVQEILRGPLECVEGREDDGESYAQIVRRLFDLDTEESR